LEADIETWLILAGFSFVMIVLLIGEPIYRVYWSWKEKRAFRLRDRQDAARRR
jgi:hypothetical protein